jgi:hypothetical protein
MMGDVLPDVPLVLPFQIAGLLPGVEPQGYYRASTGGRMG